jgi:hypothetical protein
MKKLLKIKGQDGKWQTVASLEEGMYGPRVGVNMAAVRALLATGKDGWENFSVFDERPKDERQQAPSAPRQRDESLDDSIPF